MQPMWNKLTYALITGASRGIGRAIAVDFAKRFAPNSLIFLVARSKDGLKETKDIILSNNPNIRVETYSLDLSNPKKEEFTNIVNKSVEDIKFEYSLIVHNAGSLGDLSKGAADLDDLPQLQEYFAFNVFSMMMLNTAFLNKFPSSGCPRLIINITSLCAIKPMKNFALYCAGKATREMFLNVLADEDPSVVVLNYSPGPVLTDMADEILTNLLCEDTKQRFAELRENGGYLTTEQTVAKLVLVLDTAKFKSGDHVDYFDEI